MNLDDLTAFRDLDSRGMLGQINSLPAQLDAAYDLGRRLSLPDFPAVDRILIAAAGSSTAGPDLFACWAARRLALPVQLHSDFDLPLWARGPSTLVIVVSHSGETPEMLSIFDQATGSGCPVLAMGTGGRLESLAQAAGVPHWNYAPALARDASSGEIVPAAAASATAVSWTFGLIHSFLFRLGLLLDPNEALRDGIHAMRNAQMSLLAEVPAVKNPAKRMAGQMVGRWVTIFSAGYLLPVARRWKAQLNLMAKTWAQVEALPEAGHTTLEGLVNPARELASMMALFLRAPGLDAHNLRRLDRAREFLLTQGINTDTLEARGLSSFAHLWTSLLFADYCAYFLAMANGVDPTAMPALAEYQSKLSESGEKIETHHRID